MKPYPDYRDTGMPWLELIPAHWDVSRTKRLFQLSVAKAPSGRGMELLSLYTHIGVRPRKELEQRGNKASTTDGYWIVRRGDVIVNKLLAWMGAVGVSHYTGVTSPAYDILRPVPSIDSDYFHYLFRTGTYLQQFKSRSRGIMDMRLRLYFDQLGQIDVPVPPIEEQRAIVRFLDGHSRTVNQFIRNKRRMIELLNEQKQAIINRAVTRGLAPSVRLKPSGIDWLGDIPEQWEVRLLKHVAVVRLSGVDKHSVEGEVSIRLCNYNDVYKNDRITPHMEFMAATATPTEIERFALRRGDVVITKDSEIWTDIAVPSLIDDDLEGVICSYHLALIRPDDAVATGEFIARALAAPVIARQFHVAANGVTRYGLSYHAIKNGVIVLPPHKEQDRLCEQITQQLGPLGSAIQRAQREIDLIREYRTRLISDVVAGKIDVRDLALPMDDEGSMEVVADEIEGDDFETCTDADEPELVEEADV